MFLKAVAPLQSNEFEIQRLPAWTLWQWILLEDVVLAKKTCNPQNNQQVIRLSNSDDLLYCSIFLSVTVQGFVFRFQYGFSVQVIFSVKTAISMEGT